MSTWWTGVVCPCHSTSGCMHSTWQHLLCMKSAPADKLGAIRLSLYTPKGTNIGYNSHHVYWKLLCKLRCKAVDFGKVQLGFHATGILQRCHNSLIQNMHRLH
jgi:hypothetical protein